MSCRSNINIIVSLNPNDLYNYRFLADENNKNSKELWKKLEELYNIAPAQNIQNLLQKLDALVFNKKKELEENVWKLLKIWDELYKKLK